MFNFISRTKLGCFFFILLFAVSQQIKATSAAPLALHTDGPWIVNSAGKHVVLRGIDIPSLEWSPTGDNPELSFSVAIHKWHVSLIRLPISQDLWEGHGQWQPDGAPAYRALIDKLVLTASDSGVYVLVDLHWSDMGHWGLNVGQHDLPDDNTTTAWADIAAHFANNPAVLFDAYNEPHDVPWNVWRNGGVVAEGDASYHSPGMQGVVDTIRKTGAQNIITVGGLGYAYDLSGVTKGYAIDAQNLVYSFHFYPPEPRNWGDIIGPVAKNNPILIGEFGADATMDYSTFMPNILKFINNNNYNATAWSMHTTAKPCLIDSYNYVPNYNEGTYIYSWLTGGPDAPQGMTATGANGHVSVSWQQVKGIKSYRVYRSPEPPAVPLSVPIETGTSKTTYVDSDVASGKTYYYQVSAINDKGVSGLSEPIGATVGVDSGFKPPIPTFTVSASVTPASGSIGSPISIASTVTNTSVTDSEALVVDMEVHDVQNSQVGQQTVNEPRIGSEQTKNYLFSWTPTKPGKYTVKLIIYGGDWYPRLGGQDTVAQITVDP